MRACHANLDHQVLASESLSLVFAACPASPHPRDFWIMASKRRAPFNEDSGPSRTTKALKLLQGLKRRTSNASSPGGQGGLSLMRLRGSNHV